MITCDELSALNPPPHERGRKLPVGPTDLRDPGGLDFIASWQAHVDAGRIGNTAEGSEEARAIVLANERLICGRQRTIIG